MTELPRPGAGSFAFEDVAGANRHWHFDLCTRVASGLGMELGWKLEIVRGAGHVSQGVYDRAEDVLRG